jgi:hypothetical protein
MGVPGNFAERAPAALADTELFAVDAYRTSFDARVLEVDREGGRLRLDRTAFCPKAVAVVNRAIAGRCRSGRESRHDKHRAEGILDDGSCE